MKGSKKRIGLYSIAGVYLIYLAWQLIRDFSSTETNKVIIILAIILFIAAGGFLVGYAIYYSIKESKERKEELEEEKNELPTLGEIANINTAEVELQEDAPEESPQEDNSAEAPQEDAPEESPQEDDPA